MKALTAVLIGLFAGLMLYAETDLPPRGELAAPANRHVSPYYIQNAYEDAGAPNMVTVVLVDYRGFDTLAETVVIFAAGLAVLLILRGAGPAGMAAPGAREPKTAGGLGARWPEDEPEESGGDEVEGKRP